MKTVTKKEIAIQTAQLLNEKIYIIEQIVNEVFNSLREIIRKVQKPTTSVLFAAAAGSTQPALAARAALPAAITTPLVIKAVPMSDSAPSECLRI